MIRLQLWAALAAVITSILLPGVASAEQTSTTPAKGEDTPISVSADDGPVQSASSSGSLIRTFVGLAIVLAVIYGLYWVLKQVKSSREESTRGDGLATVASIGLGPNRGVHLVRAGEDFLLVGVAEHAITPLRAYTREEALAAGLLPEPGADETSSAATPQTVQALQKLRDLVASRSGTQRAAVRLPAMRQVVGSLRERTVRS
jgi:flagellar protein FliO/FliZ